jgi:hypothetical protein
VQGGSLVSLDQRQILAAGNRNRSRAVVSGVLQRFHFGLFLSIEQYRSAIKVIGQPAFSQAVV